MGFGFYYLYPLNDEVQPTVLFNPIYYALTSEKLQVGLELAFAISERHDMELISPLGEPFTMERKYNLLMGHVFMTVNPLQVGPAIRPYTGGALGLLRLWDYRVNQARTWDKEIVAEQTTFSLEGKVGVSFFSSSSRSILIEARAYVQPFAVNRPIFVSRGLGSEMDEVSTDTRLHYLAVGGGVNFSF
jgi:hypothetical protein